MIRTAVGHLALVIAALAGAAAVASLLGAVWWPLDLLSPFQAQYASALLASAVLLLVSGRRRLAAAALVGGVLVALRVAPLYVEPPARPVATDPATHLRVVAFNLLHHNRAADAVVPWLAARDVDLLALIEVDDFWHATLRAAFPDHHHAASAHRGAFGIHLLSPRPFTRVDHLELGHGRVPAIEATLDRGGIPYTVLVIHPYPPTRTRWRAAHEQQLAIAAEWARAHPRHALVIGDFNATPWSRPFVDFVEASGYLDSARGFGLAPTWTGPHPLLAIPIDHALHTADLAPVDRAIGPALGSDHRPLSLTLAPVVTPSAAPLPSPR